MSLEGFNPRPKTPEPQFENETPETTIKGFKDQQFTPEEVVEIEAILSSQGSSLDDPALSHVGDIAPDLRGFVRAENPEEAAGWRQEVVQDIKEANKNYMEAD